MALIRHINEKDLLLQVAQGNQKAFEELFYAYHNQLGAYIMGWTKSTALTEEIVQDVFLKIWTNRETLHEVERFDNYLFIICRNHTFNILRKAVAEKLKSEQWAKHFENEQTFSSENQAEDYLPLVAQAVAALPPQQQRVYILKREQHLKYEDIGTQMGISPETARKHLAVALKNITVYVKAHLPSILPALSACMLMR